jgi:hypothetical protein
MFVLWPLAPVGIDHPQTRGNTRRVDTHGEVDIAKIQRDVVDPVLARMLKPGELERVNVKWGRYDHAPGNDENYDELIVNLVVAGEMFGTAILDAEDDREDSEAMRDRSWINCRTSSQSRPLDGVNCASPERVRSTAHAVVQPAPSRGYHRVAYVSRVTPVAPDSGLTGRSG